MDQSAHLWLYFVLVFGIVVLPGLDMAFVLASSLAGGRSAGFSAVAGIIAGGFCHLAVGATGIAVVLKVMPSAFNALLFGCALYLGWIGLSIMRSKGGFAAAPLHGSQRSLASTFRRGLVTSLLNPKAYLFTMAVLPQFLQPEAGAIWLQAVTLSAITAFTQAAVYGAVALAGGQARGWLESKPTVNAVAARAVGALLMLAAVATALQGFRRA